MSIIFLYWRFFVGGWMFFWVLGGMFVKKVLDGWSRTWVVLLKLYVYKNNINYSSLLSNTVIYSFVKYSGCAFKICSINSLLLSLR